MTTEFTITRKYSDGGAVCTTFVNFDNGTYAKVIVRIITGLKAKTYTQLTNDGNYDRAVWSVGVDSLGLVEVVKKSTEAATAGQTLNHSHFGLVTVLAANNGRLTIRLSDGTEKMVMQAFFMNGIH
jgi:hypothetical protein